MSGYRVIDLNMFYCEHWSEETGTWWEDTLTIDAYIYESDGNGVRKYETGVLIHCDEYETQYLAEQFPMSEYGSDWWIFRDEVEMPTRRIKRILDGIKIDRFDMEPSQVVSSSTNRSV